MLRKLWNDEGIRLKRCAVANLVQFTFILQCDMLAISPNSISILNSNKKKTSWMQQIWYIVVVGGGGFYFFSGSKENGFSGWE